MRDFKQFVTSWLPPLAGIVLIALFVSLAFWQLERAAEKEALAELFEADTTPQPLAETPQPVLFQPLTANGRYLSDEQVLIDNIIRGGRVGFYVITPFETRNGRLLLVNRGWIPKEGYGEERPALAVGMEPRTITARAGRLPRVALPPESPISDPEARPLVAVFPETGDIAAALGRDIDELVLLLAPDQPDGFWRDWRPPARGSSTHYGYAFQWFALAVTVLVILVWQVRKRIRDEQRSTT